MIPEVATDENIRPVLAMLLHWIFLDYDSGYEEDAGFYWADLPVPAGSVRNFCAE